MSTLWLRHSPSSAAVARHSVLAACADAGLAGEAALDAAQIAGELVGNAVRHAAPLAAGRLALDWSVDSDGYQIAVTDGGGPGAVAARRPGARDTGGRGLMIVDALSSTWGVATGNGATTVWARGARQPNRQGARHADRYQAAAGQLSAAGSVS